MRETSAGADLLGPLFITGLAALVPPSHAPLAVFSETFVEGWPVGPLIGYVPLLVAVAVAVSLDLVLGRLATLRWPHPGGGYVVGVSVGLLVRSPELWPYVLGSVAAVLSRYALVLNGRRLWGAATVGLGVLLLLAPSAVEPLPFLWSKPLWPMAVVWGLGALVLWRLGRLHLVLAFLAAFAGLAWVRSLVTGHSWLEEIAPLSGPPYQIFLFFLLTDPDATPRGRIGQTVTAIAIALLETACRLAGD